MSNYKATERKLTLAKIAKTVSCTALADFMLGYLKCNFQDGILNANKTIAVNAQLISYAEKNWYFMGFLLRDGYLNLKQSVGLKQSDCIKCFGSCPHKFKSHKDKLIDWAKQMPIAA